jgi:hypothetical protein
LDGHRAVTADTGETEFRVRGNRLVRTSTGEAAFRVRGDSRVVDAARQVADSPPPRRVHGRGPLEAA